ncbi:hypothetical protein Pla108_08180 [Botrimarina colliarenosi]|uniref:Uncharacterized protein n=1 Tax=Botrimarina colliarenosi TaxID=2528001 RepID=A0A5C6AL23_9BACT|nr:hypothetical protein [Botrimarina colliarenosi]TWT99875.1 hypothetical protein Pla108_08180 [Botrimarina colliarenosi]
MHETIEPSWLTVITIVIASLVAMAIVGSLLVGLVAAARHKRWGVLLAIPVLLLLAGFLLTLLVSYRAAEIRKDFGGTPALVRIDSTPDTPDTPQAPIPPLPEVATDAELEEVAAAAPKIDLGKVTSDAVEPDDDQQRPGWVNGDVASHQRMIAVGPFTTPDACRHAADKAVRDWLEEIAPGANGLPNGAADPAQYVVAVHNESRDTSVGEVHLRYVLAEVNGEQRAVLSEATAKLRAELQRRRGVTGVAFGGAGVLTLVAFAHMLLRAGGSGAANKSSQ